MADITKCTGIKRDSPKDTFICPLRDKCYRFTAPTSLVWQSWFVEVPYNEEAKECEHLWKTEKDKNDR